MPVYEQFKEGDEIIYDADLLKNRLAERLHHPSTKYGNGPFKVTGVVPVSEWFVPHAKHNQFLCISFKGKVIVDTGKPQEFSGYWFKKVA